MDPRITTKTVTYHEMGPAKTRTVYVLKNQEYNSLEEVSKRLAEIDAIEKVIDTMKDEFRYVNIEGHGIFVFCETMNELESVFNKLDIVQNSYGTKIRQIVKSDYIGVRCAVSCCYDGDGREIEIVDQTDLESRIEKSLKAAKHLRLFLDACS